MSGLYEQYQQELADAQQTETDAAADAADARASGDDAALRDAVKRGARATARRQRTARRLR